MFTLYLSDSSSKKSSKRFLFLFNDIVLLTIKKDKEPNESYDLQEVM